MPTSDIKATGAAMVSSGLRAQIKALRERDGVSSEDISQMLGIPVLVVEHVLGGVGSSSAPADSTNPSDVLDARAAKIEDTLADAEEIAAQTLAAACTDADNWGVRVGAAKTILEIRAGGLRPKKTESGGGIAVEQLNIIIQQAVEAHARHTFKQRLRQRKSFSLTK